MLIRKQQLWRINDCKAIAGEHITTQHKPVVFVVRMNRAKPNKIVGRKTIKWWKCIDGVAIEYRERVKVKYEEEIQGCICWKCGGALWAIHEYGWKSRKNQEWWITEVESAIREKKDA